MRNTHRSRSNDFFYDCRMGRCQRSLLGIVLVFTSERKDENCKIECSSHVARAGEMYSEIYSVTRTLTTCSRIDSHDSLADMQCRFPRKTTCFSLRLVDTPPLDLLCLSEPELHVFSVYYLIVFLICREAAAAFQSSLILNLPTFRTDDEQASVYHPSRQVWALGEGGRPRTQ